MSPVWDPAEARSTLYKKVHRHSPGMISFSCELSDVREVAQTIKTEAFREFVANVINTDAQSSDDR